MLFAIICGTQLDRHWVPPFSELVVEGEGLTAKLKFIPHDLEEG